MNKSSVSNFNVILCLDDTNIQHETAMVLQFLALNVLIRLPRLTGLTQKSCFIGKAAWGYVALPSGPADFYLSVKHLGWKGTKGGAALWSPERCFPWQWNVFSVQLALCRVSTGSGYSRNRKTLQIIWQHMAPSEAGCCQDRMQYSQLIVCVFVCSNNRTYSGTRQWRFQAQMWPMHPSFFLNYSFTEQCKMS